jgi:MFS family permease
MAQTGYGNPGAAAVDFARDERPVGHRRYVIAVLLLLMITVAYVDRMIMSMAGPVIAKEFGLSPLSLGTLFSSFLWGYAATMLLAGWSLDRFGVRIVVPAALIFWSLSSMATGVMTTLFGMYVARIFLGIGETPCLPGSNVVIREWSPLKERGAFTAIMMAGVLFGPGVTTAPAAWVVAHYGWRPSFLILSAVGFVWLAVWLLFYRKPENARWISEAERQYILSSRAAAAPAPKQADAPSQYVRMSLGTLLRHRSMIGIMLTNGPQTYALYFLLTWLPGYLIMARKFNLMKSGNLTSAMFLSAIVIVLLLGRITDRFLSLSREQAARGKRRFVVAVIMLFALASLAITPWVANQLLLVGVVAVSLAMVTTAITLTWALVSDLIVDEKSAGRSFSILSFAGQVMGLLAPVITGWIVGKAGFTPVFIVTAGLVLCGTVAVLTLPTRQLQPRQRA